MSKEKMGSSTGDLLKEEGTFAEGVDLEGPGGRRVAACRGDDDKKDLEEQDGGTAQDWPFALETRAARLSGASLPARAMHIP